MAEWVGEEIAYPPPFIYSCSSGALGSWLNEVLEVFETITSLAPCKSARSVKVGDDFQNLKRGQSLRTQLYLENRFYIYFLYKRVGYLVTRLNKKKRLVKPYHRPFVASISDWLDVLELVSLTSLDTFDAAQLRAQNDAVGDFLICQTLAALQAFLEVRFLSLAKFLLL